jgi:hypothetical protein
VESLSVAGDLLWREISFFGLFAFEPAFVGEAVLLAAED